MKRVEVSLENNFGFSFLPIVKFLVAHDVIVLSEGALLNRRFQSGADVVFEIPDELVDKLVTELAYHRWTYRIDTVVK